MSFLKFEDLLKESKEGTALRISFVNLKDGKPDSINVEGLDKKGAEEIGKFVIADDEDFELMKFIQDKVKDSKVDVEVLKVINDKVSEYEKSKETTEVKPEEKPEGASIDKPSETEDEKPSIEKAEDGSYDVTFKGVKWKLTKVEE